MWVALQLTSRLMCLFQKSNRKISQKPLLNNDLLSLGPYHSIIIGTAAQVPEVAVLYRSRPSPSVGQQQH